MVSLRQTLCAQLPEWAQPSHAVLRYVLHRRSRRQGWRLLRRSGGVAAIVGLVTLSWLAYHVHSPLAVGDCCGSALLAVLYFPMIILQFVLLTIALLAASEAVATVQQRGTWELFRVTSHGAEKLVLTSWAAVFYRMRFLMVALMVPRVLFAGLMLVDISAYRGHYLDLYMTGSLSPVPLSLAVVMLAAFAIAALIQFPVLIALNAAIGMLISAAFRKRRVAALARVVVFSGEIALFSLVFRIMRDAPHQNLRMPIAGHTTEQWVEWLLVGTLGDQGLRLMDLRNSLQTWIDVDWGVWLGGALLILVIAQILIAYGALMTAVRLVTRPVVE